MAGTVDSRYDGTIGGGMRLLVFEYTDLTDADTLVTGYSKIYHVSVGFKKASTSNLTMGWEATGGTITFNVTNGPGDASVMVLCS